MIDRSIRRINLFSRLQISGLVRSEEGVSVFCVIFLACGRFWFWEAVAYAELYPHKKKL
jgi:hypothetical protein